MNDRKPKWLAPAMTSASALAANDKANSAEMIGREADRAQEKTGDKVDEAAQKPSTQTVNTDVAIGDAALTTRIKSAIRSELGLKVAHINVDTADAVVTLTGTVDSQENSNQAQRVTGTIPGVKRTENRLLIKGSK